MKYYFQSGKVCLARVSDTLEENQIFIGEILPGMNQTSETQGMTIPVVEFSREGYKIRKVFDKKKL